MSKSICSCACVFGGVYVPREMCHGIYIFAPGRLAPPSEEAGECANSLFIFISIQVCHHYLVPFSLGVSLFKRDTKQHAAQVVKVLYYRKYFLSVTKIVFVFFINY